ncbi:MAG: NYN domain-containing protein [Planctomycetota bacterium]|nr:NYN domain-containing protein [Planctomycetota bacterium]
MISVTRRTLQGDKHFLGKGQNTIHSPIPSTATQERGRLQHTRRAKTFQLAAPHACEQRQSGSGLVSGPRTTWLSHEEKMTDVNRATEMLTGAFENRFDTAVLVSADSDLVVPIEAVRRLFPAKRLVVALLPARAYVELRKVASAWLTIGRRTIRKSQFPDRVIKSDGFVLERPADWR